MSTMKNCTVMVAGGAGFVGSALVRELLDRGLRVVCFDNYMHGVPANVEDLEGPLILVQGSAQETWKLIETIKKYDVEFIVDCIGDTYVPSAYEMPQRFFETNLQATFNLLMATKLCGVKRMLYVSSTEVYGQHDREKFDEDTPLYPLNTYAVSKLAADRLCFTLHVEHQVPVVTTRIFNCYGPRETHPYIIPELIAQLDRGPVVSLGNIKAERDLTYVHDTALALIAVMESDLPNGDVINVGSDTTYRVDWLAYKIAELMEVPNMEIRLNPCRLRRLDLNHLQCDNTKLRRYTNWSPKVDIEDGLRRTIQWYRDTGRRWCWESSMSDVHFNQVLEVEPAAIGEQPLYQQANI